MSDVPTDTAADAMVRHSQNLERKKKIKGKYTSLKHYSDLGNNSVKIQQQKKKEKKKAILLDLVNPRLPPKRCCIARYESQEVG